MLFYFTGTGNSKYVAEKIAAVTGGSTMNIADCMKNGQYSFALGENEALGFVVPVYFVGIPMIVAEFLRKLKISSGQDYYSYAVLNCGGTAGNAERILRRTFPVDAVFGIAMVSNYVPSYPMESETEIAECFEKFEHEIQAVTRNIQNRGVGSFNAVKGRFPRATTFVGYPLYQHGRKTNKFTASDACIGCGLCERICPRKAIQLTGGKPAWVISQCELCLGCLHRCPSVAINYGKKSAENGRYVNPYTKL